MTSDLSITSSLSILFPTKKRIDGTDLTLYYQNTSWGTYKSKLAAIIKSTQAIIAQQIELHSADALLVRDSSGGQVWRNSIHNGIDFRVANFKPYALTWGDMRDLLKGLAEYCTLQRCRFEFSVGSGPKIGEGALYKA